MNEIITVKDLTKSYGDIKAVQGISLKVKRGGLFAFLGPNGAGKSTTIDMLCTLQKPDGGSVIIDGCELGRQNDDIRKKIGVVFQGSVLDPLLTVKENLETRGRMYGLAGAELKNAVRRAAATADVTEFIERRYGKLSGGQRRRADIARALVNTPEILFLDEPTTGLDPKTKEGVWQTVQQLQKAEGMTVFLTTHYMEEAAAADYITIMNRGIIAAEGTPAELKEQYSADTLRIKTADKQRVNNYFAAKGIKVSEKQGIITVSLAHTIEALPMLCELGEAVQSFEVIHGSMDDVFLNIVGEAEKNV